MHVVGDHRVGAEVAQAPVGGTDLAVAPVGGAIAPGDDAREPGGLIDPRGERVRWRNSMYCARSPAAAPKPAATNSWWPASASSLAIGAGIGGEVGEGKNQDARHQRERAATASSRRARTARRSPATSARHVGAGWVDLPVDQPRECGGRPRSRRWPARTRRHRRRPRSAPPRSGRRARAPAGGRPDTRTACPSRRSAKGDRRSPLRSPRARRRRAATQARGRSSTPPCRRRRRSGI